MTGHTSTVSVYSQSITCSTSDDYEADLCTSEPDSEEETDETSETDAGEESFKPPKWKPTKLSTSKPPVLGKMKWSKRDIKTPEIPVKVTNPIDIPDTTSALFKLFFDAETVKFMFYMTNLYARRDKNKPNFETNVEEMYVFLAMLLLSGYNPRSQRRLWWESSDDVFCKAMSDAILRNRFEELIAVVHFADNMNLEKGDKMESNKTFLRPIKRKMPKICAKQRNDCR